MVFGDTKILLLLWVLPLLFLLTVVEVRTIRRRFESFARLRLEDLLSRVWSYKKTVFKSLLLCLSFALLVFALARPRWDFEWKDVHRGGTDIVIALDLSTSMLATDISPNRLERAKREIMDLLKILKGDRVGIVAFAGVAFVYTPLTVDYRLVDIFMKQLSLKLMPVQGTAIGEALHQSIDALEKASSTDTQGKAVILITDGEDQGTDVLSIAKQAKEKGIHIHAVGIGSEAGAPIPLPDGGFKKDQNGNIVVSKLDERTLQSITAETGGLYVRSSTGNLDLDQIYKSIKKGTPDEEGEISRQKIWHERFQIFLALALFLLVLEFFMRSTLPKKQGERKTDLSFLVLFCIAAFLNPKLHANDAREGQKAFEAKDYKTASDKFTNAEIKEPDQLQHAYNRGVSQFYNKQYKEASEAFAKSALSQDKNLAERSYYNLGNTEAAQQKYEEAIKAYEQALGVNPQDKEAQENLQWAKKKLEEQKQKQEENKDKKDEKENKDEKKDQKQDQSQDKDKKDEPKKDDSKKDEKENKDSKDSKDEKENAEKKQADKENSKEKENAKQNEEHQAQQGKEGAEPKELSKEQAEKLLRMMENQEQVYGMPPKYRKPSKTPDKDW